MFTQTIYKLTPEHNCSLSLLSITDKPLVVPGPFFKYIKKLWVTIGGDVSLEWDQTPVSYVYLIYINGVMSYIGCSCNPLQRYQQHKWGMLRGITNHKLVIYGVYQFWYGYSVEEQVIYHFRNHGITNKKIPKDINAPRFAEAEKLIL